ncbi:MAG: hypothetical protein AABW56_05480 [Nanoarchaeota archaeon]
MEYKINKNTLEFLLSQDDINGLKVNEQGISFEFTLKQFLRGFNKDIKFNGKIKVTHYSSHQPGLHYYLNENALTIGIKPPYIIEDLKNKAIEITEFKELYKIEFIKFI